MTTQRLLLRVAFGSLALTACSGAVAVIFAGHDTLWRIVATCFATAIGALLLAATSSLLDREVSRRPGLLATALVVVEYLLTLGQIWDVFGRAADQAGVTFAFLLATGIPAIAFLAMLERPLTMVAGRVGLACCGVALALLLIGTWGSGWGHPRFGDNSWFDVSGFLASFGFLAVLAMVGTGLDRRHWRWAGVAAATAGFALATWAVLLDIHSSSVLFVCITSVAIVVAHANVMVRCPLRPGQRWLLWGTIGAAILTALLVDLGRLTRPWQEEMLGRLAGAGAIIAGCGTLALIVLARLNRHLGAAAVSPSDVREVALTCPSCGAKQHLPVGGARCASCGLGIEIRLG